MYISTILKRSALAAILVFATAGASLAATGWIDQDSVVRHKPAHLAKKVNWVHDGQQVEVIAAYKGWYKLQIPGKDGWVKQSLVSFYGPAHGWNHDWSHNGWSHGWGKSGWGYGTGGGFCVYGAKAQICIGGGY